MKVVLVHDWLIHMRGGEKVLEAIAEIYPDATVYTLFCQRKKLSPVLQRMKIKTSFLQYLPGIRYYYRWLLPLLPLAIGSLRIESADVVISSSHCVAKGVKIPAGAVHICYCHTPMRYLWGFEKDYFKNYFILTRYLIRWIFGWLRKWDLASNTTVHHFVSNSENVKKRIESYYGREATTIYPPLDAELFRPLEGHAGDYYLVVSAFVPYKKIDIVLEAFNLLDRPLLIVGAGPLEKAYKRLRRSEKIFFLGSVSGRRLRELYAGARALIFPTHEDFGIVPLESQSCGTPVIAYKAGGALESVQYGEFFDEQTPEAVQKAVLAFEVRTFDRYEISRSVQTFDRNHFKDRMKNFVDSVMRVEPAGVIHA